MVCIKFGLDWIRLISVMDIQNVESKWKIIW